MSSTGIIEAAAPAATHSNCVPALQAQAEVVLLDDLVTQINDAHAEVERAFRIGIDHALRAGELLLQAKKQVLHGKWETWLKGNVSCTPRTARSYMQIAALDDEKRQRVADLPLREALKAITKQRPSGHAPVLVTGPGVDMAPVAMEPTTPAQRAEELVAQLDEAMRLDDEMTTDDLRAAFKRRFDRSISFSRVIDPIDTCASTVRSVMLETLNKLPPERWRSLLAELQDELADLRRKVDAEIGTAEGGDQNEEIAGPAADLRRAGLVTDLQAAVAGHIAEVRAVGEECGPIDYACNLLDGDSMYIEPILPVICAMLGIADPWPGLTHIELNRMLAKRGSRDAQRRGLRILPAAVDLDLPMKLRAARHRAWLEGG